MCFILQRRPPVLRLSDVRNAGPEASLFLAILGQA